MINNNKLNKKSFVLILVKNLDNGIIKVLNILSALNNKKYPFNINILFYEKSIMYKTLRKKKKYFKILSPQSPLKEHFLFKKIFIFIINYLNTLKFLTLKKPKIIIVIGIYSLILIGLLKPLANFIFKLNFKTLLLLETNFIKLVDSKPGNFYKKILRFFLKISLTKIDYCVSQTKENLLFIQNYYKIRFKNYTVIPPGIKIQSRNYRKNISLTKDIKTIISAGRFHPQKDFETIIKAFKIINEKWKFNKIRLILVGDGPLRKNLENLVTELNLRNKVVFTGWKFNIYHYLKNADIFVYSSNHEGFGYVILEAMNSGLPIIATDTPFGPSEILENGKYGILVPIDDYKKMAENIIKFIEDKKNREKYGKLAYQRVKYFDERKMLNQYKNLFLHLISEH